MIIYSLQTAQIFDGKAMQFAVLQYNEISTKFLFICGNYTNMFLYNLSIKLLQDISMNKYVIKPVENEQPYYISIFNLKLIELKTLKTHIKIHLKIEFI